MSDLEDGSSASIEEKHLRYLLKVPDTIAVLLHKVDKRVDATKKILLNVSSDEINYTYFKILDEVMEVPKSKTQSYNNDLQKGNAHNFSKETFSSCENPQPLVEPNEIDPSCKPECCDVNQQFFSNTEESELVCHNISDGMGLKRPMVPSPGQEYHYRDTIINNSFERLNKKRKLDFSNITKENTIQATQSINMDIIRARKHFTGPIGIPIDSIVVILDTITPGSSYKYPIEKPKYRFSSMSWSKMSRAARKLSVTVSNTKDSRQVTTTPNSEDCIELTDIKLAQELDAEYNRIVKDEYEKILAKEQNHFLNSPNRIITLVASSPGSSTGESSERKLAENKLVDTNKKWNENLEQNKEGNNFRETIEDVDYEMQLPAIDAQQREIESSTNFTDIVPLPTRANLEIFNNKKYKCEENYLSEMCNTKVQSNLQSSDIISDHNNPSISSSHLDRISSPAELDPSGSKIGTSPTLLDSQDLLINNADLNNSSKTDIKGGDLIITCKDETFVENVEENSENSIDGFKINSQQFNDSDYTGNNPGETSNINEAVINTTDNLMAEFYTVSSNTSIDELEDDAKSSNEFYFNFEVQHLIESSEDSVKVCDLSIADAPEINKENVSETITIKDEDIVDLLDSDDGNKEILQQNIINKCNVNVNKPKLICHQDIINLSDSSNDNNCKEEKFFNYLSIQPVTKPLLNKPEDIVDLLDSSSDSIICIKSNESINDVTDISNGNVIPSNSNILCSLDYRYNSKNSDKSQMSIIFDKVKKENLLPCIGNGETDTLDKKDNIKPILNLSIEKEFSPVPVPCNDSTIVPVLIESVENYIEDHIISSSNSISETDFCANMPENSLENFERDIIATSSDVDDNSDIDAITNPIKEAVALDCLNILEQTQNSEIADVNNQNIDTFVHEYNISIPAKENHHHVEQGMSDNAMDLCQTDIEYTICKVESSKHDYDHEEKFSPNILENNNDTTCKSHNVDSFVLTPPEDDLYADDTIQICCGITDSHQEEICKNNDTVQQENGISKSEFVEDDSNNQIKHFSPKRVSIENSISCNTINKINPIVPFNLENQTNLLKEESFLYINPESSPAKAETNIKPMMEIPYINSEIGVRPNLFNETSHNVPNLNIDAPQTYVPSINTEVDLIPQCDKILDINQNCTITSEFYTVDEWNGSEAENVSATLDLTAQKETNVDSNSLIPAPPTIETGEGLKPSSADLKTESGRLNIPNPVITEAKIRTGIKRPAESNINSKSTKQYKSSSVKNQIFPKPLTSESHPSQDDYIIDPKEIADNNDPKWKLFHFSEPRDFFEAVQKQWNMPFPDPHVNFTNRFYKIIPTTSTNYIIPGNRTNLNIQCLKMYENQIDRVKEEHNEIKYDLDKNGQHWRRREIKRSMDKLQSLDQVYNNLLGAWDNAYRFYLYSMKSGAKDSGWYMSELNENEGRRSIQMVNAYESFYGQIQ